jgi:hypothetical protein
MDANFSNQGELQYHSTNLVKNYHVLFANLAWYDTECLYITSCFNSSHLFGCIGMKKHEYCILNKRYARKEYERLVPMIIAHMRKTGEWGRYYPPGCSPFGFNETAANVEHPLDRGTALRRGWRWHEDADVSREAGGDAASRVLVCEATGKPYRITPQELRFYRQMDVPLPRRCPDQRRKDRVALRNPHRLWKRACMQCSGEMTTTYAPDRPEIVYCGECYLKEVY